MVVKTNNNAHICHECLYCEGANNIYTHITEPRLEKIERREEE